MIKNCFAVLLFILSFTLFASQSDPSFQQVKKIARIIWADHRIDMYCHCKFDKQLQVDWKSCGYEPGDMLRAKRIEWEHIVPASWLGRHRACWANGQGRNMCEKSDKVFREMYTDLHNLIPVIGEIHKERQAYRFAEFSTNKSTAHGCEFYIDRDYRTVEPNSDIKGLIARAHLYMATLILLN